MAYSVVENCPLNFKDWTSRATLKCSNGNTYHCVKDEFSRIVEVCTTPLWIQKGHCPIYNTGLKKIDSNECPDPNCSSEVYRSDAVYKYRCYQRFTTRITTESMQTTIQVPITTAPNVATIVGAVITVFVVVLLVILGIIIWRKKIQCLNPCIFNRAENGGRDTHSATAGEEESSCKESLLNNQQASDSESGYPKELKEDVEFITQCQLHLQSKKTLALIGNFGSGRQTLANQIARRLQINDPSLEIKVLNEFRVKPSDFGTMMSTIFILPDLIKAWYTDEHTYALIQFLKNLQSDADNNNCFILATFHYDEWNIINHKSINIGSLFPNSFQVNTVIQKLREICSNSEIDISDEMLKRICNENTSIGKPLTLALTINNKALECNRYYLNPIQFIIENLKALDKSNDNKQKVMFKALVFIMIHGGEIARIKLEDILDRFLLDDLMETEDRKKTIQECIQQLINVYIKETADKKSYKMIHGVITKCTFLAAAENHHDLLFTECHYFPLLECIRHKTFLERLNFSGNIVYDNEKLQIGVPTEFYPKIAKMFVERNEMMDMLRTVRFLENKKFQKEWFKAKEEKNEKEK